VKNNTPKTLVYSANEAVAHCDVARGDILYRVFLLRSSLQVDISFWPAAQFRAIGPKFRLAFGAANAMQPPPAADPHAMISRA